ncbi:hypothetical protein CLOP_g7871 [Closterium sp. NIES-67]|nr:hypothetical protein CLOP_g7871 [Closterium sp. NIES-67]
METAPRAHPPSAPRPDRGADRPLSRPFPTSKSEKARPHSQSSSDTSHSTTPRAQSHARLQPFTPSHPSVPPRSPPATGGSVLRGSISHENLRLGSDSEPESSLGDEPDGFEFPGLSGSAGGPVASAVSRVSAARHAFPRSVSASSGIPAETSARAPTSRGRPPPARSSDVDSRSDGGDSLSLDDVRSDSGGASWPDYAGNGGGSPLSGARALPHSPLSSRSASASPSRLPPGRGRPGVISPSGGAAATGGREFARSASQPVRKLDSVRHSSAHTPPLPSPLSSSSSAGAAPPPGLPPARRAGEQAQGQARARPMTSGKAPLAAEGFAGGGRGAAGAPIRITAAASAAAVAAAADGASSATAAVPPGGAGGLRTVAGAVASRALRKSASAPQVRPGEGPSNASTRAVAERAALKLRGRGHPGSADAGGGGGAGGGDSDGVVAGVGAVGAERPRTRVGRGAMQGEADEDSPRLGRAGAHGAGPSAGDVGGGVRVGGFAAPRERPTTPPRRDMSAASSAAGVAAAVGVGVVLDRPKTPSRMDMHDAERARAAAAAAGGGVAAAGPLQQPLTPRVLERPSTPLAGQRPTTPLLRAEAGLERPRTPTRRQDGERGHAGGAAAWAEGAAGRREGALERPKTPTRRQDGAAGGVRGEEPQERLERPTTPLHGMEAAPPRTCTTWAWQGGDWGQQSA